MLSASGHHELNRLFELLAKSTNCGSNRPFYILVVRQIRWEALANAIDLDNTAEIEIMLPADSSLARE